MPATTLPIPFFQLSSLRVCAGSAPLLYVLEERLSSLGYNLQVLSPTTSISIPIFFRIKSSYYSPQSKEQNPQQAEQGHAQMQQCV
jgi:hypothetical protein